MKDTYLNNLLGVVIGYVDLIKAYHDKPELVKKNANHLEDAVNRIVGIIKQLTGLVVKNRPPLIRASLARMVDSGIRRYQIEFKIDQPITTAHGPDLFECHSLRAGKGLDRGEAFNKT